MRLWTREFAGWALLCLGLGVFFLAVQLATNGEHYMIEASCVTMLGFVVFRAGLHLLKIAMAARICQTAVERSLQPPARPRS